MVRSFQIVVFLLGLIAGNTSHAQWTESGSQDQSQLVGTWVSFEMGGKDIGDQIKKMTYVFGRDQSLTLIGEMTDGKRITHAGKYSLLAQSIEMTFDAVGTKKMPYSLQGEVLTIKDPELDSWVRLRKASLTEQATPADAVKPRR